MRRIYYDVTHLRHNIQRSMTSGIRRVDLEFANYCFLDRGHSHAIQYGLAGPSIIDPIDTLKLAIANQKAQVSRNAGESAAFRAVAAWLRGDQFRPEKTNSGVSIVKPDIKTYIRFLSTPSSLNYSAIPKKSIYMNVAQHALGYRFFFKWLKQRPDVQSIFFVHDLLPLDYPEFWRSGYQQRFVQGVDMLSEVGRAFVVSSESVKDRLEHELRKHGRQGIPILCLPFPSLLAETAAHDSRSDDLGAQPYFVMVGTIEPRKNHLLLLNIWRRFAERGGPVPKLIILGKRGWENEQVADMLDRCNAIQGYVIEAATVPDPDMRKLVTNARALLFPSFNEGFGLPLAEALTCGTPVVASDIRVLHESSQGKAIFLDPLDGPGWMNAITALSDRSSPLSLRAAALAAEYRPTDLKSYFAKLETFLERI